MNNYSHAYIISECHSNYLYFHLLALHCITQFVLCNFILLKYKTYVMYLL